jgi:Flp pilus assembly protein TadB
MEQFLKQRSGELAKLAGQQRLEEWKKEPADHDVSNRGGAMTRPRIYVACLWAVIALFALYQGIAHGSAVAWWFLVTLVPPLIVFLWWMADRAALERRIRRLEAQSEIGDERRVIVHTDLTKVEHKLQEIETRVAQVEDQ